MDVSPEVLYCPGCGTPLARPGVRFCHSCGEALPQPPPPGANQSVRWPWLALIAALVLAGLTSAGLLLRRPTASLAPSPAALVASSAIPAPATRTPMPTLPMPTTLAPSPVASVTPSVTPTATLIPLDPKLIVKLGASSGARVMALDLDGHSTVLDWDPNGPSLVGPGEGEVYGRSGPNGGPFDSIGALWVTRRGDKALVPARAPEKADVSMLDLATGARTVLRTEQSCEDVGLIVNPLGDQFILQCYAQKTSDLYVGSIPRADLVKIGEDIVGALVEPAQHWSRIAFAEVRGPKTRLITARGDGTDQKSITIDTPAWLWPYVFTTDGEAVYYTADDGFYRQPLTGGSPDKQAFAVGAKSNVVGVAPELDLAIFRLRYLAADEDEDLMVVGLTQATQTQLATHEKLASAAVSPDGKHVLSYVVKSDLRMEIKVDPATSGERLLRTAYDASVPCWGCEFAMPAEWLADGRLLYNTREEGEQIVLRVEQPDGSDAHEVILPAGVYPSFWGLDPEGVMIGSRSTGDRQRALYLIDLNRGALVEVTRSAVGADWLAPGGRLVYQTGGNLHVADMLGNDRIIARDVAEVLGANLYAP